MAPQYTLIYISADMKQKSLSKYNILMWVLSEQKTICNLFLIGKLAFEMRIGQNISYKRYIPTTPEGILASLQVFPNGSGNSVWAYSYYSTDHNELKLCLSVISPIIL